MVVIWLELTLCWVIIDYAYGLTMFENDDIDLYQEENNPKDAKYKTPNGFSAYEIRKKQLG
jgi:penicillin amidase